MAVSTSMCSRCGLLVFFLLIFISYVSSEEELPPHITKPDSHAAMIVDILQRSDFSVYCNASGYPAPSYQWKKNGRFLRDDDSIRIFPNGRLYFRNFTGNDNGIYQCLAENNLGTSLSPNVPIWLEKPAASASPTTVKQQGIEEGNPVLLSCEETPETIPKWNKKWYVTTEPSEVAPNHRIGTDSKGNLRFAYTTKDDSKKYSCVLLPPVLKPNLKMLTIKTIDLRVNKGTKDPQPPLKTEYYSGSQIKGSINNDITLECFFSGKPLPNITWTRGTIQLPDHGNGRISVLDSGRQLKISKLQDTDEGEYVCEAHNGLSVQREVIFVNVTSPPMKVPYKGLLDNVTTNKEDITLMCHTTVSQEEKQDTPVWFRNGKLMPSTNLPDPARYSFNEAHTELYIKNPQVGIDTACFQCNVSNSEGYAFYDAYLKVIEPIKITKRPDPVNEISRNQAINISIEATADISCSLDYVWFLNGVSLKQDDLNKPPYKKGFAGLLVFDPRNVSHEILSHRTGRYQCKIFCKYDTAVYEFTVSVKEGGQTASLAIVGGGVQNWWIILLCLLILLILIVIIVFLIIRRNSGETYPVEKTELQHHLNPKQDLINQGFQEF